MSNNYALKVEHKVLLLVSCVKLTLLMSFLTLWTLPQFRAYFGLSELSKASVLMVACVVVLLVFRLWAELVYMLLPMVRESVLNKVVSARVKRLFNSVK